MEENTRKLGATKLAMSRQSIDKVVLKQWADGGYLKVEVVQRGGAICHEYDPDEVDRLIEEDKNRSRVCYARVSSLEEEENLQAQISYLRKYFPNHILRFEYGSGFDDNRPFYKDLMSQIAQGKVAEVRVYSLDRLCHPKLFNSVRALCTVTRTVLRHKTSKNQSTRRETSDDLFNLAEDSARDIHKNELAKARDSRKLEETSQLYSALPN